jgi:hypothetical protein
MLLYVWLLVAVNASIADIEWHWNRVLRPGHVRTRQSQTRQGVPRQYDPNRPKASVSPHRLAQRKKSSSGNPERVSRNVNHEVDVPGEMIDPTNRLSISTSV